MAVFSTNQARHFYLAKELKTGKVLKPTDAVGSILPKVAGNKETLYFQYMSPAGVIATDRIDLGKLEYAKATGSDKMAKPLIRKSIELDKNINEGKPVAGQDYILGITFTEFAGLGSEDMYNKYGLVHAHAGMDASRFYKVLAASIVGNLSRDIDPLLTVYVEKDGALEEVAKNTKADDIEGDITKVVLEQVEAPWVLGTFPIKPMPFLVNPREITVEGDDVIWGKVEDVKAEKFVLNGKEIADLEYFCMGERGDTYRGMGFPNVIHTTYLVDPSKEYDTLDLHFYEIGSNVDVQKSERTMTLVAENDGSHTAMNALIAAINTAAGTDIKKVDEAGK